MEIQRNAPDLLGAKPCPSCQKPVERNATLCVHCGYDMATGKKTAGAGRGTAKPFIAVMVLIVVMGLAVAAAVVWRRAEKAPDARRTFEPLAPAATPAAAPEEPAATERRIFDAKKAEAEATFRRQLDEREPLYQVNDKVELRRKNGLVDKGTLMGISGVGAARVAIVATATSEIGVPLMSLDNVSRRRVDALYRDAFIQHMLSMDATGPDDKPVD